MTTRTALIGVLGVLLAPNVATAQLRPATRVLIVTGLSGDPTFAAEYGALGRALYDSARSRWGVADSDLVYLAEDRAADSTRIRGRSTRENIAAAVGAFAARDRAGDVVLMVLLGHGSGEGVESSVNLPGPDPVASDYVTWLDRLRPATVVFVNAASASGDFAPLLASPDRIVITATHTALERNATLFGQFFVAGLTSDAADADKDGSVSLAEAFAFATAQVTRAYDDTHRLQTEHAILADSGHLAPRVAFGGSATSRDPRIVALVAARRTLESRVDSLRAVKETMDSTAYQRTLEQLLLDIARRTQAIDSLGRGGVP